MIQQVWLVADARTKEVRYLKHGRDGDVPNWRKVGPFAFTNKDLAEAVAQDLKFFPADNEVGPVELLEVDASSFIRAVFNGFPPFLPDAFFLDQALLPITSQGAGWVDDALGAPIWTPLFDEGGEGVGLDWLDRVLEQVAARLQVNMETIQAIGTLNAAEEDQAADVEQTATLVTKHVNISIIPEDGTVQIGTGTGGEKILSPVSQFWLHTDGLYKMSLPELEIRNVPARWVTAAGGELMGWAAYSVENDVFDGLRLQGGGPVPTSYVLRKSPDPIWKGHPTGCLRLIMECATYTDEVDDDDLPEDSSGHTIH